MQLTYHDKKRSSHRIAVGALFFLQGICFSSWASRIPTIQQKLGLSETELGLVLFAIPIGLMISLPLSGWLVAKKGSHAIAMLAMVSYAISLVTIGLANSIFLLIIALLFFGFAGNMSNIAINTQAIGVEALYKRSIMASFHGMWSVAGFTGAAVGTIMIGYSIVPFHHFAAVMLFVFAILLFTSNHTIKEDTNKSSGPIFALPDKSLINLGIIAFCSMICEGAMFDWSGIYFKKVVMAEGALIGAGYTAFMCTMAAGRFIADWFTSHYGLKRTIQLSGLLTASGLMLAVLQPQFITAICGFFLVGFGVSSVVPLVYGEAGKSKVLSPGVALAAVSTIGFLGFLIGPPVIGLVAGATSLRVSFTIIALMGLCITVMAGVLKNR